MPPQSEMIIRGAVDDSANKLTYETDMLVEANETFLKKDKALVCSWERSSRLIKSVLNSPSSLILLLGLTTS
jgi:hypothetical protein